MTLEQAREIMEGVNRLTSGEKVALKRSLGQVMSAQSTSAMMAFYHAFPFVKTGQELPCFLCACGACAMERLQGKPLTFVAAMKQLAAQEYPEGTRRKLLSLLDTPMEYDVLFAAKMGRLIQYMKAKNIKVDFAELLRDLCSWDHPNGFVQRKWAREFFGDLREPDDKEGKENVD